MRDEDLKNLPQSIERWRFAQMLKELGFGDGAQDDLAKFWVDPRGVHAVVYAKDENGRRFRAGTEDDPMRAVRAAVHEISIPLSGRWTRPEDDGRCTHEQQGTKTRCVLESGHTGQHRV